MLALLLLALVLLALILLARLLLALITLALVLLALVLLALVLLALLPKRFPSARAPLFTCVCGPSNPSLPPGDGQMEHPAKPFFEKMIAKERALNFPSNSRSPSPSSPHNTVSAPISFVSSHMGSDRSQSPTGLLQTGGSLQSLPNANHWMEFSTSPKAKGADGAAPPTKYYHNFATSKTTSLRTPAMNVAVAPVSLKTHTNVLRARSEFMPRLLRFRSWFQETKSFDGSVDRKEIELLFDTATDCLSIKTLTPGATPVEYSCDNVDGLTFWDFHVGKVVNIMGRETTCMQASLETQRWYDFEVKRLTKLRTVLNAEVKKYNLKEAMSSGKGGPLNGSRVKSLGYILEQCETIAAKLYQLRPAAVKKVLAPYE